MKIDNYNQTVIIFETFRVFVIVVVLAVLAYILGDRYLKSQAVDGCMSISSYTYTNSKTGVTTSEPIEKSYKKCLAIKGYAVEK